MQSQDRGLFLWSNWRIRQNKSRACCSACASSIMHKRCTGREMFVKHDTCKSATSPFSTAQRGVIAGPLQISEPVRVLACNSTWWRRDPMAVRWSKRSRLIHSDQIPPSCVRHHLEQSLLPSTRVKQVHRSSGFQLFISLTDHGKWDKQGVYTWKTEISALRPGQRSCDAFKIKN